MRQVLFVLAALNLFVAPSAAAIRVVDGGVEFRYTDPSAATVHLAGAFNEWSTTATPLSDPDRDGTWEVVIPLSPGRYEYKFVVNGGTWVADPDNPVTGGDYGNSIVEIGSDGKLAGPAAVSAPALPSGTPLRSNTPLHSRVYLGGFFRLLQESNSNQPGDERLRVDRPNDQFNLDVTANLSDRIWGTARLQVRTDTGGFNELGTQLYKAQTSFSADDFTVRVFYNEEMFRTEDPLRLLGYGRPRASFTAQERAFGQGRQGILLEIEPWQSRLEVMYADTFDEDIFGPTNRNENTGTDVLAARWTRPVGKGRVGLTYRGLMSDWWINFNTNTVPQSVQDHLAAQTDRRDDQKSDWFELANDEHFAALDLQWPLPQNFEFTAAGGLGWYRARFDLGNREDVQGAGFSNGKVDLPIGEQDLARGMAGLRWTRDALTLHAAHELRTASGMEADERSVIYRTQSGMIEEDFDRPARNAIDEVYAAPNNNQDLSVLVVGPAPEETVHRTDLGASYRWQDFEFGLRWIRTYENFEYADFFGAGAVEFERWRFESLPFVRWNPFSDPQHHLTLRAQTLDYSDPAQWRAIGAAANTDDRQGYADFLRLERSDLVLDGRVPFGPRNALPLDVRFDLRYVDYREDDSLRAEVRSGEGNILRSVAADENFFQPFVALVYSPTKNVEVEVGYGVDPRFYDVISAEGWDNGRQQFRERYLRGAFGGNDPYNELLNLLGEDEIADQNRFVINALVKF
jgi:hypothetical protein